MVPTAIGPGKLDGVTVHPWIDKIEVRSGLGDDRTFVHVPEVATNLVFRTTADRRSDLIVVGPRTRGSYHPARATPVCIRLRLRPGRTRRLLGVPVQELVNRAVPITHLWGATGRRLQDRLADAEDPVALLTQAITTPAADAADEPRLLTAAMQALSPGAGHPGRLSTVAGHLGISERHLRTIFTREIGLSPKHFARIARLRHVLARAGTEQWATVADDAGFFDQSHMITDFRTLMGVSPAAFLAGDLPAPSPCADLARAAAH